MAELLPIDAVRPSTYNPRSTDPARLRVIELSIRKCGWLFPIYATASGEVLSGHQRHLVAGQLGIEEVPVETVRDLPLNARKAINILFNRATNEMTASTTTGKLEAELAGLDLDAIERLPDAAEPFPCLAAADRPIEELLALIGDARNEYGTATTRSLDRRGKVRMPVLVSGGEVLNGIGRLRHYQRIGLETVPVVEVQGAIAEVARALVNKVSMDFDINDRYADFLRHNSYRRTAHKRARLGLGFVNELGIDVSRNFDILERADRQRWVATYGERVVDFGAGLLIETELLRSAGIDVSPFEPYVSDPEVGEVSTELSRQLSRTFLEDVAAGKRWDTVFISSVLNSVPFDQDRRHIATILAALATAETTLHAHARSDHQGAWRHVSGAEYHNKGLAESGRFALDYEPGIAVSGFHEDKPKVQKHFTPEEFRDLFAPNWKSIRVRRGKALSVIARCRQPVAPKVAELDEALRFEFNLPMPDGDRLGLGREAVAAFKARRAALRKPI